MKKYLFEAYFDAVAKRLRELRGGAIIRFVAYALQIFIVILLYESIKVMEKMYILMIGKLFCKNYH